MNSHLYNYNLVSNEKVNELKRKMLLLFSFICYYFYIYLLYSFFTCIFIFYIYNYYIFSLSFSLYKKDKQFCNFERHYFTL